MKIVEVNIDRFGQFYKWSCRLADSEFLTVYGPNEAGKSTLVAFIKCIFFGFPRKAELKPYTGDGDHQIDLGGSVTLKIPDVGEVRIVRHYQRKNGRAVIYLESGETVTEDVLSEWMSGMDRELYEAIFCFDLEGLKGIDQLKPAELNHFLFSTGMMGNAELYNLEKRLEKEAGDLFKSGGRNPIINQTVSELNVLREKKALWEKQMDDYTALKNEMVVAAEELRKLETSRRHIEQDKREFLRFKAAESLLIDFQRIKKEIADLPTTSQFPENGKERYNHWRTLGVSLEGERADIEQKINHLQESLSSVEDDDPILKLEKEIESLRRESFEKGTWDREFSKLKEQVKGERDSIRMALEQLNMSQVDHEAIKEIPVSLSAKQSLNAWMNKWQDVHKRKQALEMTVEEETNKREALQEKQDLLLNESMPDVRFYELEQRVNAHHPERLEKEKERIKQELENQKRSEELERMVSRLKLLLPVSLFVLLIVISSLLIKSGNWVMGMTLIGTSLILSAAIFLLLQGLQKRFKPVGNLRDLGRRLHELEAQSTTDINESLYLYNQEKSRREQLSIVSVQLDEGKRNFQSLIQKLEEINMRIFEIEAGIHEWRKNMGLPECEIAILPEVFQLTERVREQIFRLESLETQAVEYQMLLEGFSKKLKDIGNRLGQPDMTFNECDLRLENAKIQRSKKEKLIETLSHLQESLQSINEKIARYDEECEGLKKLAGVETEEAFYLLNNLEERKAALIEQQQSLHRQLMHVVPQDDIRGKYFSWLSDGFWEGREENDYIKQIDELDHRIKQIQKEQSDRKSKLEQMEKDETYADILHEYEEKHYLLNKEAKKWGTLSIALSLLRQAKEDYRETRLPKILESAGDYLYKITNRVYKKIYYTETDGFTLERTDGAFLGADQLSRGTGEQLYLSLRLALVDVYNTPLNLPIIIDDGFVNFDSSRRRQVIEVLKDVANVRQVLLFTCHHYNTKAILELSRQKVGGEMEHVGPVISDSAR
ncbi:MAG TPA: AAA family ATPase [Sporolactobacillaceae bacterium]|nr:AAA family ATPase [Sporolactobacillaceae bacterium]